MTLKISPPNYNYCPFCGKGLGARSEEGKVFGYCADCKWTYYPNVPTSAGAVVTRGGKVLMVQRNRDPYKGTWMFPAGFVEFGEHPEESVVREVREEVGLEATKVTLLEVIQVDDDPRAMGHFNFFYKVEVKDGEIKNNDFDENIEIAWFDVKNLPDVGWNSHKRIIEKYL